MEGRVKVVAILKEPAGKFEDVLPVQYEPAAKLGVVIQTLAMLRKTGGFLNIISETEIEWIPMDRVESLNLSLSEVVSADLSDLANLKMPPPGQRS